MFFVIVFHDQRRLPEPSPLFQTGLKAGYKVGLLSLRRILQSQLAAGHLYCIPARDVYLQVYARKWGRKLTLYHTVVWRVSGNADQSKRRRCTGQSSGWGAGGIIDASGMPHMVAIYNNKIRESRRNSGMPCGESFITLATKARPQQYVRPPCNGFYTLTLSPFPEISTAYIHTVHTHRREHGSTRP